MEPRGTVPEAAQAVQGSYGGDLGLMPLTETAVSGLALSS